MGFDYVSFRSLSTFLLCFPLRISSCLRSGLSWLNWWVSFAPDFQCLYFCGSSCLFYLRFNFDFYVSKKCTYELGIFHANQTTKCLMNQGRTKGEGWSTEN